MKAGALIFVAAAGAIALPHGATAATGRPAIVSIRAVSAHAVLPASGAKVAITVQARNAKTCTFFWPRTAASSIYPQKTISCASGRATAIAPAIPNRRTTPALLEYGVRVKSASGKTVFRGTFLHEAAAAKAPAPPAAPATAELGLSPAALPSAGGTTAVTFTSTSATTCTLTSTPALWSGPDPMTVSCNGNYAAVAGATTTPQQWTIVFTATGASGTAATATQQLSEDAAPIPPPSDQKSLNWAGYVFPSSAGITQVSGNWTVPALDCGSTPNGGTSTWVGLGGAGDNTGDLLQTGVDTDCDNGTQVTYAWWELVPMDPEGSVPFRGFAVSPGDRMAATVFQNGSKWETKVDDLTTKTSGVMITGQGWGVLADGASTFTILGGAPASYGGATTAEWIQEDYTDLSTGNLVPIANFRSVTFSGLTTSVPSWSLSSDLATTITDDNGNGLVTPLAPVGGTSFSVVYG